MCVYVAVAQLQEAQESRRVLGCHHQEGTLHSKTKKLSNIGGIIFENMHHYSLVPKESHVWKESNDSTLGLCIVP